ncbi:MAG: molybdopterin molybdotransferase MoeA [Pseudomonadota bacterium]
MKSMISVDEAIACLLAHPLQPQTEQVSLSAALGKRLAVDLCAKVSQPPLTVSAMDGYAVKLEDVKKPQQTLKIIGEVPAGKPYDGTVRSGEAVRIFTGGALPQGTDHIVIQEDVTRHDQSITCHHAYERAQAVRPAGLDFHLNDVVLEQGRVIDPSAIAIAAAANHDCLTIDKPIRVGILANGNELQMPGSLLSPGEIVSSSPMGLAALIQNWGGKAVDLGIARDDLQSILDHLNANDDIDLYLPIGGASVGDYDYMHNAFDHMGFEPVFRKVAVKPGKPTWFSKKNKQYVLGLPGNPASSFVCAHLFLSVCLGHSWHRLLKQAILIDPLQKNGPREQFLRAAAVINDKGQLTVAPYKNQDSSLLHPFRDCNALIRREGNAAAKAKGDLVSIFLIGPL